MNSSMNRSVMVKILCCLVTAIISSEAYHPEYYPWRRTQLTAITHFFGIEDFYTREMRLQRSKSLQAEQRHPSQTADMKKILCNQILSNHRYVDKEFPVNTDLRELRHELKKRERPIYEQIFQRNLEVGQSGCFACNPIRVFVNPYVVINAYVGPQNIAIQEYAFKCLARTKVGRHLVQYYVSEEYNVNIRRTKKDNIEPPFITGRFVFYQNEYDDWRLLEMAEESALLTRLSTTYDTYEKLYLKYRKGHDIVENADEDPVCGITDGQKLRMCVSMWNTSKITGGTHVDPQFEQRYDNLLPHTHSVDTPCIKRKVMFLNPEIRQYTTAEMGRNATIPDHHEWTILCHVHDSEETVQTLAIARGYSLNSIFVFKLYDEDELDEDEEVVRASEIIVDHHSFHVSVVDDWVIQVPRAGSKKIEF